MTQKHITWSEKEIEIVKDAIRRSNTTPVKDLVNDVAETLGRTEQSVRNRFYREKRVVENNRSSRNVSHSAQQIGVYHALGSLKADLGGLSEIIEDLVKRIDGIQSDAKLVEDWAKDTLEVKKYLAGTIDSNGIVQKVHAVSSR